MGTSVGKEILKISNLCVSFDKREVISDFSLVMRAGEKLIVSGPNGSGKTSLLKCILGCLVPVCGKVEVFTEKIAYCKQNFTNVSFPISAREVVEMALFRNPEIKRGDVFEAMKMTDTLDLADRAFFTLSGGEQQRINLARCFCQKAELLLFDEPSSFLDSDSVLSFVNTMKILPDNICVIVVTHNTYLSEKLGWKTIELRKGE